MNIDPIEFGKVVERLESMDEKVNKLVDDMAEVRGSMNKGWGIVIGAVAVIGLFAGELLEGLKRLIGIGHPNG